MAESKNMAPFQIVALFALIAAIAQVSLGGVVRVSDSGLGCPDWPLCHGQIIPALEFHTLIEYSHRLTGILVGFSTLVLTTLAWRQYREDKRVLVFATLALVLVLVAGGLGGATVLTDLAWWFVLLHLGIAEILVAAIIFTWISAVKPGRHNIEGGLQIRPPDNFDWLVITAMVGLMVLLMFGSYMVGRGYGSSCGGWPLCNGIIFPTGKAFAIHMAHRYMTIIIGGLIMWTAYLTLNRNLSHPYLNRAAISMAILFVTQIMIGATMVWTGYTAAAKGLHLIVGTLVWTTLVLLAATHFDQRIWSTNRRNKSKSL